MWEKHKADGYLIGHTLLKHQGAVGNRNTLIPYTASSAVTGATKRKRFHKTRGELPEPTKIDQ